MSNALDICVTGEEKSVRRSSGKEFFERRGRTAIDWENATVEIKRPRPSTKMPLSASMCVNSPPNLRECLPFKYEKES